MGMLSNTNKQIYLQRMGYYCDLIDGIIGAKTKAAIADFKKAAGLEVNSTYDTATDNALRAAYAKRDPNMLSKHFKKIEFKCHCNKYCNGYPAEVSPKLIGLLEKLRAKYNTPIRITSGIRCRKYNSTLRGSATNSAHISGKAADIYIAGASLAGIKKAAYSYGAKFSYYGTSNMGSAVHINV